MYQSSFSCFDVVAPSPALVAEFMLSAFLATIFVAACDDVRCFIRLELLPPTRRDSFFLGISCTLHKHSCLSPQRGTSSAILPKATLLNRWTCPSADSWTGLWWCNCCMCLCVNTRTTLSLWMANDRNVLYVSQSSCSQTQPIISGLCVPSDPRTHTPEKKTVQVLWLRDPTRMKTASVTLIIVTPHFIVSNVNGVVRGETVN